MVTWYHALQYFYEYISDRKPFPYQPITVCIVSKHADIIHSNEDSSAITLSLRLLSIP